MKSFRSRSAAALLAVGLLAVTACGSDDDSGSSTTTEKETATTDGANAATGDPLKVGYISVLSGPVGVFHTPPLDGMQAFFDEYNANGGVNGRPIEIETSDTAAEVPRALQALTKYAEDPDVLLLAGLGLSGQVAAILERLPDLEIPAISVPSSSPSGLPNSEWYFSLGEEYGANANAGVSYVAEQDAEAKIGFVSFDSPATRAVLDVAKATAEKTGIDVVDSQFLPADATDASQAVSSLLSNKANWIVIGAATQPQFQSIIQSTQVQGFDGNILALAGGAQTADFETVDSESYTGVRPFRSPSEELDGVEDMVERAGGKVDDRTEFTEGWVLGQVIAAAFEACGDDCTRAALRDALETVTIEDTGELTAGPVSFDPECHQGFRSTFIYEWDGSKPVEAAAVPLYDDGPCA